MTRRRTTKAEGAGQPALPAGWQTRWSVDVRHLALADARQILARHRLQPWHPALAADAGTELLEALRHLQGRASDPDRLSARQRTDLHRFLESTVRRLREAERAVAKVADELDTPGPWNPADLIITTEGSVTGAKLPRSPHPIRATLASIGEQRAAFEAQLVALRQAPPKRAHAQAFDRLVEPLVDYFDAFFDDRRRRVAFLQDCWNTAGGPDLTAQNFRDAVSRIRKRVVETTHVRRLPDGTIAKRHIKN